MTSIDDPTSRIKTLPTDPQTADEFDTALAIVWHKYHAGDALTRRELAALITSATRVMREAAR